jgi:hypothetical protein
MTINPALADLQPLVGRWRMELHNASFLPDRDTRVSGSIEIDWTEDGSALRMRQGDSEQRQAAVWIIGRDDSEPSYSVLYADNRGVSRIFEMSFEDGRWRMWRDTPAFSQRFDAQLDLDAGAIRGRWQKSEDQGANREQDFNVDYLFEGGERLEQ